MSRMRFLASPSGVVLQNLCGGTRSALDKPRRCSLSIDINGGKEESICASSDLGQEANSTQEPPNPDWIPQPQLQISYDHTRSNFDVPNSLRAFFIRDARSKFPTHSLRVDSTSEALPRSPAASFSSYLVRRQPIRRRPAPGGGVGLGERRAACS